jgi:predicted transglutaminase-like cysteine proteinase
MIGVITVGLSIVTSACLHEAKASFPAIPWHQTLQVERLNFDMPSLAPIAHTRFCLSYPEECKVHRMAFRRAPMQLDRARWDELVQVNRNVNRNISPLRNTGGVWADVWRISPGKGDCNDYAVTKRHVLLKRGWPSRSLLLAEVKTGSGEHHLVLVVRTRQGDLVLDNIRRSVVAWSAARYQWLRVQSPHHPMHWSTVTAASV